MHKTKENIVDEIFKSKIKDKTSIIAASHKIDSIREKYGKRIKGLDSTSILRKLRDSKFK